VPEVVAPIVEAPEPIIEEVPEVVAPIVEEIPEVVEVPEPAPIVEEIPEVVEMPEPLVEEVSEVVVSVIETPEPVVEETPVVNEQPAPVETSRSTNKYTVQLLSLSKFSQSRLNTFLNQHGLSDKDVMKRQEGSWMKITYGDASSIQEANQIKDKLMRDHNITEAFITGLK